MPQVINSLPNDHYSLPNDHNSLPDVHNSLPNDHNSTPNDHNNNEVSFASGNAADIDTDDDGILTQDRRVVCETLERMVVVEGVDVGQEARNACKSLSHNGAIVKMSCVHVISLESAALPSHLVSMISEAATSDAGIHLELYVNRGYCCMVVS